MRRIVVISVMAVVVVVALLASYATPLGAATLREISAHLDTGILNGNTETSIAHTADATANPTPTAPAHSSNSRESSTKVDRSSGAASSAQTEGQAYLGVVLTDTENGAQVSQVYVGGPAQKAGLKKGDILKKVNGTAVSNAANVVTEVGKAKPGDKVSLAISRDGQESTIVVTAGTRPEQRLPEILGQLRIPELEGLGSLPLQQLFGSFLGGELTFQGKDGQPHTVKIIPGRIKTITSTSISIEPSDSNAQGEYEITEKTVVYIGPIKRNVESLREDDRVVVIVAGDSNQASVIVKTQPGSWPFERLIPNAPAPRDWGSPKKGQTPGA